LNYRHAFHAGNFADLVKHACLTSVLRRMTASGRPLWTIDTHAGAGLYALDSAEALKSGEASAGIGRLMADPAAPAVFAALKAQVLAVNPSGGLTRYPGSPLLIDSALRARDELVVCELQTDEFALLEGMLGRPGRLALCADGYVEAAGRIPRGKAALVVIDPPFERGDEIDRILACVRDVLRKNPGAVIMIWLPLKDLETFDGFLRRLEALTPPPTLVAEARLRPLDDPMRMNGCAMVVINDPPGTEQDADEACRWAVAALGEARGRARTWRL
jgi:23S rRNA (adenine2030-N6)-methyltransferase